MGNVNKAMFGAGCFWCVEDDFLNLDGVHTLTCGYSGGDVADPTYEQVCTGTTGHTEVVLIEFNSDDVSYQDLVYKFFEIHDPTTRNRQGPDVGTQYRSAIFYFDEDQKKVAEKVIMTLTKGNKFLQPIVTEVTKAAPFYKAEEYHQQYYCKLRERNQNLR